MILINLLPPNLRRKEAPKIVLPEIPVKKTLLVLASAVLALQLLLSLVAVFYSTRHKIAQHEMTKFSAKLEGVRQAKKQTSIVAKKLQDIRILTEKKFYWVRLLNEVTLTATRGIWLRKLSVEELSVQKPAKAEPAPKVKKGKKVTEEKKTAPGKKGSKKKETVSQAGASMKPTQAVEKHYAVKLEGSCTGGAGQETALIGKYLKALRDNAYFQELFGTDIDLSGMNQRKMGEVDVFDFTIYCRFKKEKL